MSKMNATAAITAGMAVTTGNENGIAVLGGREISGA
jgi:hypothetical protein